MHLNLDKKVFLVTGGTKGIGRSIVRAFLQENAIVHFCSRTSADVSAAGDSLAKEFPDSKAIGNVVDVTQKKELESWVEAVVKESGRINGVVGNVSALAMEGDAESWQKAFQTDLMGTINLINAALPHLEKTKGCVVNINSVSGRDVDFTGHGPYGAMKAALIRYTAGLAHSLAPKGMRANTLSPGNIYVADGVWGGIEKSMPDFFKDQLSKNPMGRMGKPEEIADSVVFLASERASFINGSNLVVDGALCNGVQF